MKKSFIITMFLILAVFCSPVFAVVATGNDATATSTANSNSNSVAFGGNAVANGGSASATIQKGAVTVDPTFVNMPSASATIQKGAVQNNNDVDVNNKVYNTNKQSQKQGQLQGQGQSQSVSNNNGQNISPSLTVNTPQNFMSAPEASVLVPLQGGKVGDWTVNMPKFANPALVKLNPATDVIVNVLDVYFGNPFSRITFEEIETYLLKKAAKYDGKSGKIRYTVRYQDSVITSGLGGGGTIGYNGNDGSVGSSGSIVPGVSKSTANPIFIITFYEIQ